MFNVKREAVPVMYASILKFPVALYCNTEGVNFSLLMVTGKTPLVCNVLCGSPQHDVLHECSCAITCKEQTDKRKVSGRL
jgi:hypothetical protein